MEPSFIIAQEILTLNIQFLERRGDLNYYRIGRGGLQISHLFYADDMLLFTNAKKRSIANLMQLLRKYEKSSGQEIRFEKSGFYPSKRISNERISFILGRDV